VGPPSANTPPWDQRWQCGRFSLKYGQFNESRTVGRDELDKGDNLLDSPIHTPPQCKSKSLFSCHRGWAMGRGIGREGEKKSIITLSPFEPFALSYRLVVTVFGKLSKVELNIYLVY